MEYQEFLCAIEEKLNKELKGGARASIYTAPKNNSSVKQGILIEEKGADMAPAIYLEDFYERVKEGEEIQVVVREIVEFYASVKEEVPWNCDILRAYETVRNHVIFRLVNTDKNIELLQCIPSIPILDLSIVFCVLMGKNEKETASIQISNEHLKKWGVQTEELYRAAVRNTMRFLPAEFFTMRHAIEGMFEEEKQETENLLEQKWNKKKDKDVMYILTNGIRSFGAACIVYPHVLEMIGEMLKEDFFILPSSIHETIIVPESEGMDQDEMSEMVHEINETQVAPEEVLSNHAYFYRRTGNKLMVKKR